LWRKFTIYSAKKLFYTDANAARFGGRALSWQCKQWHRFSTNQSEIAAASEAAIKLYFDKQLRVEHKLPQSTKKFDHLAKAVLQQMQDELDAGEGKSVYGS